MARRKASEDFDKPEWDVSTHGPCPDESMYTVVNAPEGAAADGSVPDEPPADETPGGE